LIKFHWLKSMFRSFLLRLFSIGLAVTVYAGVMNFLSSVDYQRLSTGQVSAQHTSISLSFSVPIIQKAEASAVKPTLEELPIIEQESDQPKTETNKTESAEKETNVSDPIVKKVETAETPLLTAKKDQPVESPKEPASHNIVESPKVEEHQTDVNEPANKEFTEEIANEESVEEESQSSLASAPTPEQEQTGMHQEVVLDPKFKAPPNPPVYPRLARKRGMEGVVWLDVWLDRTGEQTRLEVFDSSGIDLLDQAAIDAVAQWQFVPKHFAGMTIASRVRIPVEFNLQ